MMKNLYIASGWMPSSLQLAKSRTRSTADFFRRHVIRSRFAGTIQNSITPRCPGRDIVARCRVLLGVVKSITFSKGGLPLLESRKLRGIRRRLESQNPGFWKARCLAGFWKAVVRQNFVRAESRSRYNVTSLCITCCRSRLGFGEGQGKIS